VNVVDIVGMLSLLGHHAAVRHCDSTPVPTRDALSLGLISLLAGRVTVPRNVVSDAL
jgi:hypothetical protein